MNEALQAFLTVSKQLPGRSISQMTTLALACRDNPALYPSFQQLLHNPSGWEEIRKEAQKYHEEAREKAGRQRRHSRIPAHIGHMDVVRVLQGEAEMIGSILEAPRDKLERLASIGKRVKPEDQEEFARQIENELGVRLPRTRF